MPLRSMRHYAPLNASPAGRVALDLEYIELAGRQQCELLAFPSLSHQDAEKELNRCPPLLMRRFYNSPLMWPIPTI